MLLYIDTIVAAIYSSVIKKFDMKKVNISISFEWRKLYFESDKTHRRKINDTMIFMQKVFYFC